MPTTDLNIPKDIKRVTLAERLKIRPASDGLLVWQTDQRKGFYYYSNLAWFELFGVQQHAGSARPLQPFIGQTFFDTSLKLVIIWDGAFWLNTTGAKV